MVSQLMIISSKRLLDRAGFFYILGGGTGDCCAVWLQFDVDDSGA